MTTHRYDINHENVDKPVSLHFTTEGHVIKDLTITIARRNAQWTNVSRRHNERAFIELFETQNPMGMNVKEQ
jgi:hypothetical protein